LASSSFTSFLQDPVRFGLTSRSSLFEFDASTRFPASLLTSKFPTLSPAHQALRFEKQELAWRLMAIEQAALKFGGGAGHVLVAVLPTPA